MAVFAYHSQMAVFAYHSMPWRQSFDDMYLLLCNFDAWFCVAALNVFFMYSTCCCVYLLLAAHWESVYISVQMDGA